jgi:hypothetical protein
MAQVQNTIHEAEEIQRKEREERCDAVMLMIITFGGLITGIFTVLVIMVIMHNL